MTDEIVPDKEDAPAADSAQKSKKKIRPEKVKKIKRRKRRILERTAENDIRYRGPLSYRHFRVLAWLCLIAGQAVVLMRLEQKLDPSYAAAYQTPIAVLQPISALALPFFLIANFATILEGQEGYSRQILRYGTMAAGVILSFFAVYERYFLGSMAVLIQDPAEAAKYVDLILSKAFPQGFISFNLFIDLFLCALFMFLLNYRPAKWFQGKKILILRLLAVFPVLYEAASIVLKIMSSNEAVRLPVWTYPFLTTKPPMTFIVFVMLAFYVKKRERLFRRHGRTHEEFQQYMQTNYNSLRFSVFAAKLFLLAALLDVFIVFVLPVFLLFFRGMTADGYMPLVNTMVDSGFGGSIILIPMIPLMLLFSYTRTYKKRVFDTVLPTIGITLLVLVYIEGSYQALRTFSVTLPAGVGELIKAVIMMLFGS